MSPPFLLLAASAQVALRSATFVRIRGWLSRKLWRGAAAGVVVALSVAAPARADAPPVRLGLELGSSWLGGDTLVDVVPWLELASRRLQVGLGAPVRLRLNDAAPTDGCAAPGIRCQDWDRWSDWTRILRHLDLGDWRDHFQLHVGDLTGVTLGHGELVWRYYNNLLMDEWNPGVYASWQGANGTVTALLRNAVKWSLAAARASGRPIQRGLGRSFEFGVQAAIERRSRTVVHEWSGDPASVPTYRLREANDEGANVAVVLDGSIELLRTGKWVVGSWAALGWQHAGQESPSAGPTSKSAGQNSQGTGQATQPSAALRYGSHLGLRAVRSTASSSLSITVEGRALAHGYTPALLDPTYEISLPLRFPSKGGSDWSFGIRSVVEVSETGWGRAMLAWDQSGQLRNRLHLWLIADPGSALTLRAYVNHSLLPADQATALAAGSTLAGQADQPDWMAYLAARYRVQGPWYFSLSGGRRWFWKSDHWLGDYHPQRAEVELRVAAGWDWQP